MFFIFFVSKGHRSEAMGYGIAELLASGAPKLRKFGNLYIQEYSQLSLRRTPLGPALSVHLREVSVL